VIESAGKELAELLKIGSASGQEPGIIEYLERRLRDMGHSPEIQHSGDIVNLVLGDSSLLITTHVDTIMERACLREEGNVIYGTGACDAKGCIASILLFLKHVKDLNVSIAFLSDEEDGGRGSEVFLKHVTPQSVIVMEPTSMLLCTSHAGNIEIEFEVSGRESHGSCVEDGVNAIHRSFEMWSELRRLAEDHSRTGFDVSIQEIMAENPFYLVPDACSGRIEVRLPSLSDAEETAERIEKILVKYCRRYRFKEIWSGYELPGNHPLVELFKKAGVTRTDWMRSWTDALNFHKKGVPAVVFGPGDLSVAHTGMEHINLNDIVHAVEILEKINRYAPEFYSL